MKSWLSLVFIGFAIVFAIIGLTIIPMTNAGLNSLGLVQIACFLSGVCIGVVSYWFNR